jgi:hypothetical protein
VAALWELPSAGRVMGVQFRFARTRGTRDHVPTRGNMIAAGERELHPQTNA